MAPRRLAGSTAHAADRGKPPLAARGVARQRVHSALQLQRRQPRADDPHARRCGSAVKLRNMLGPNHGQVPKAPTPDPFEIRARRPQGALCAMATAQGRTVPRTPLDAARLRPPRRDLHAHSSPARRHDLPGQPCEPAARIAHDQPPHPRPACESRAGMPNGTDGDDTFLRVLPQGDWECASATAAGCRRELDSHERVGEADYEFALGNVMRATRGRRGGAAASTGHALVPPALSWRDPRSSGQRPRRLLRRRRRCR